MNKKIIIIILVFISQVASAQEKNTYYYDFDGKTISKSFFENSKYNKNTLVNFGLRFENDTSFISILHPKEALGKLKSHQLDSLKNYLEIISNKPISKDNHIVINFYELEDKNCQKPSVLWSIHKNSYLKTLHRRLKCRQFYISPNPNYLGKESIFKKYLTDRNLVIKKLFFPYLIKYGSFVIIKPDGRFVVVYGEYADQTVFKVLEEITKNDN